MKRRTLLGRALCVLATCTVLVEPLEAQARPNILWITIEDASPHLGSFGDIHAHTPNLDRLAETGVRYVNAFSVAGVCAPSRSAIITGVYPTSLGTHNMRTMGRLPAEIRAFPEYLRGAGYYTTNNSKTDYNFQHSSSTWDESSDQAHWRNRKRSDQPFFAVFNFLTTHESRFEEERPELYRSSVAGLPAALHRDPSALTLPPYYPDTPAARRSWANYYNTISAVDLEAGEVLRQLEEDGLADNTIVFFFSDHGAGLPRSKKWIYDSGTHVPLIVRIPAAYRAPGQGEPGSIENELVSLVDLAPTLLRLTGLATPAYLQGRAFLGANLTPSREYVYAVGGRQDERYDFIRAVRDGRYRYIRNYEAYKPFYQAQNTGDKNVIRREIQRAHARGELPPVAARFMAPTRPPEELYDTWADPHEVHNLADQPGYGPLLDRMRNAHLRWIDETIDLGFLPEPEIFARQASADAAIYTLARRGGGYPIHRARSTAILWEKGAAATPELITRLRDEDAAVRYWAAVGLGNLAPGTEGARAGILRALDDPSPVVRVAAARAIARMGSPERALAVLGTELKSPHEWVRLHAALALDELGEAARPALADLRAAMSDKNNYVVRVTNHALNQLLGTRNVVP